MIFDFQNASPDILFALARNEAAMPDIRRAAVEELFDRDDRRALYSEFSSILRDIMDDRVKTQSGVSETQKGLPSAADLDAVAAEKPPDPQNGQGAQQASFTTKNLFENDEQIT